MDKSCERITLVFLLIACILITFVNVGCSQRPNLFREEITTFGPKPLIEQDTFQKIDLALLLDPTSEGMEKDELLKSKREKLRKAFNGFYKYPTDQLRRRNRIQERILSASNQRCGEYKNYLKQFDSGINFFLGSLTTAVAGAGAIFTGVDTIRALSGSASILSGVRSEFNQEYFSNQTIQVLTNGFEAKRREIYKGILKTRKQGLTRYPVEAAIKDAVVYHSSCSLLTGLEYAALSIERVENPGLKGAQKALVEVKQLQKIMETDPKDISRLTLLDSLESTGADPIISQLMDTGLLEEGLPLNVFASIRAQVAQGDNDFTKLIDNLKSSRSGVTEINKLQGLSERMNNAQKQTWKVLETYTEKTANDMTASIQQLKAKVTETVVPKEKELKEIDFAQEILEGNKIISEIRKIYFDFQSNYLATVNALKDEKNEKVLLNRIDNAECRVNQIIAVMVSRRAKKGMEVLKTEFSKLTQSGEDTTLYSALNAVTNVTGISTQANIKNLLENIPKEFDGIKNKEPTDQKPIIEKNAKIIKILSKAFKGKI